LTNLIEFGLPDAADDRWPRICRTLCHGRKYSADAGVFRLLQPSHGSLLHDGDEFLVGQLSVAVLVEEDEDNVDDVIGEL